MTHVILFGAECAATSGFVAEIVETESIDNVDDLLRAFLEGFFLLFSRGVGSDVCAEATLLAHSTIVKPAHMLPKRAFGEPQEGKTRLTNVVHSLGHLLAVDLVDRIVDLLETPGIRDDLVTANNVLETQNSLAALFLMCW